MSVTPVPIAPKAIPEGLPATMRPLGVLPVEEAQDRFWNLAALFTAGLLAVGVGGGWAYSKVRESLLDIRRLGLAALVESQASAVLTWIDEKKRDAERWSSTPPVRAAALLAAAGPECEGAHVAALVRELQPYALLQETAAFEVVLPSGAIVASGEGGACGKRIASREFRERMAPAFEGRTVFIRPFAEVERLGAPGARGDAGPLVWTYTPVKGGDGEVKAVLGFGRPAGTRFARLLSLRDAETSREAYAFDRRGVMLTPSRYLGDMRAAGLVEKDGDGVLTVFVVDPGGDLAEGHRPRAQGPFTQLVEAAIAAHGAASGGEQGTVLEPYRNYRGAWVVGAFRWLPEKEMAVAVEIEAREAFAPLEYLRIAFGGLFLFLLVALGAAGGASLWAVRLRLREARRLGPYRLERELGEGGMSRVYLAHHELLKRPTAVKVLKPAVATDEMIARFTREVRLCSRLKHPNTVDIYDYGRTREGLFYYAMEYLQGVTLEELVRRDGPLPLPRALHALVQACASLGDAHAQGLVHRDVKPGNLMLCVFGARPDVLKVLDFGLVKDVRGPATRDLTLNARVLGTPLYMSPERVRNPEDADARADIYALGAVAFFLLTGRAVFEAATEHGLVHAILNDPAPSLAAGGFAGAPAELEALVAACLAKDREARPPDMEAVAQVLSGIAGRHPWTTAEARVWWRSRSPGFPGPAGSG